MPLTVEDRLELSRGVAGALKNADDLQRLGIGQVNHPCIAPAPAKTGRVRPSSPNVGGQDADFSRAARMLHKCPLLACPLRPGCRWRYKPRFPGGRLSPLATVVAAQARAREPHETNRSGMGMERGHSRAGCFAAGRSQLPGQTFSIPQPAYGARFASGPRHGRGATAYFARTPVIASKREM